MKHARQKLNRYLRLRERKSWDDVPTWGLMMFGLIATMEAGYYGFVLQKFAPDFLEIANAQPIESWASATFLACVAILSGIGLQFFIWSVAAAGLMAILQKRVFNI